MKHFSTLYQAPSMILIVINSKECHKTVGPFGKSLNAKTVLIKKPTKIDPDFGLKVK